VARTEEFKSLVHNVAMHIAASSPLFVSSKDIPATSEQTERDLIIKELANDGKPKDMLAKISDGKIKKWHSEVCLLNQPYIKNPDQTVEDYIKEVIAKLGENIVIRRFNRIELGETS
jgi:elongation factor Ts